MDPLPEGLNAYLDTYNSHDVEGRLRCLAEDVVFRNYSGKKLTYETNGIEEFEPLARASAANFSLRTLVCALRIGLS